MAHTVIHHHYPTIAALLAATLALSACGGAESEVASLPPPPPAPLPTVTTVSTPLPATPALTEGTHGTIALVERHSPEPGWVLQSLRPTAAPDEIQVKVEPATKSYTVLLTSPISPYAQTKFAFERQGNDNHLFGQHVETTTRNADGSTTISSQDYARGGNQLIIDTAPGEQRHLRFLLDLGLSHVSYGAWSGFTQSTRADGTFFTKDDPTFIYFVFGDRTPPADIPLSGTATYASHLGFSDLNGGNFGIPADFSLTANFGARSISALFDRPPVLEAGDEGEYYTTGFHASGAAPITTVGDFNISLVGALTSRSLEPTVADSVRPMIGTLNGAFFGPQAAQVGGVVQFTAEVMPGTFQSVGGNFVGAAN